ncbi:MAG: aromatic acid exporter family protein [Candidatus Limiplasma sp.]|nr:aromatic acid exporter family protein [Candidatus Limiplasma sp.]
MKRRELPWYRIFEVTLGCCAAIAVAMALGLVNPMSAGVIAILSIQDTKRATLRSAMERFAAYALALLLAYGSFSLLGYHVLAFGLYLLPFSLLCYGLGLQASIPICSVSVTHFWIAGQMSPPMLLNSVLLMLIGSAFGITLNLLQPSSLKAIQQEQAHIEHRLQQTLESLAVLLRGGAGMKAVEDNLDQLRHTLTCAQHKAMSHLDNTLTRDVRYYVRYVDMRLAQAAVLQRMADTLSQAAYRPIAKAFPLADLLAHTAAVLHESNDAVALLARSGDLLSSYRVMPLPSTREEFETRATLFRLLLDLEQFLSLKKGFFQSLTLAERTRYFGHSV